MHEWQLMFWKNGNSVEETKVDLCTDGRHVDFLGFVALYLKIYVCILTNLKYTKAWNFKGGLKIHRTCNFFKMLSDMVRLKSKQVKTMPGSPWSVVIVKVGHLTGILIIPPTSKIGGRLFLSCLSHCQNLQFVKVELGVCFSLKSSKGLLSFYFFSHI